MRRKTKSVFAGDFEIGGEVPVSVQSMCATKTHDVPATLRQIAVLQEHGAGLIRVAVDNRRDVEALASIRKATKARLVVDLQENYRLAEQVAPFVEKIRYNPGHLHHVEQEKPIREKVRFLVDVSRKHGLAMRIGVNGGSLGRAVSALSSAREHVGYMRDLHFENFLVSLKSSDPNEVIEMNCVFAEEFPDIPLHLGVTEAGMLPEGEIKTRIAFENLLSRGTGETIRVSLTLPAAEKYREVVIGKQIISDVESGRRTAPERFEKKGINIVSCPSCSRVENEAFIELAARVREAVDFAGTADITIAVMGCRVNGPGETDEADLGLWCGPSSVNLKKGRETIGSFSYEDVLPKLKAELEKMLTNCK